MKTAQYQCYCTYILSRIVLTRSQRCLVIVNFLLMRSSAKGEKITFIKSHQLCVYTTLNYIYIHIYQLLCSGRI